MKLLSSVFLSLVFCSIIYSQEIPHNPKYTLSFGIADNFRLDKFNMDFAFKRLFDNSSQLRFFVSPRFASNSGESKHSDLNGVLQTESLAYSFGVGSDYLWTLLRNNDISLCGGAGLAFTYGNSNAQSTDNTSGDKVFKEVNKPFYNFGLRGIIGVEWMVSNKIGIHSEYVFTGSYNSDEIEHKSSFNDVPNPSVTISSSGISLNSKVVACALSGG